MRITQLPELTPAPRTTPAVHRSPPSAPTAPPHLGTNLLTCVLPASAPGSSGRGVYSGKTGPCPAQANCPSRWGTPSDVTTLFRIFPQDSLCSRAQLGLYLGASQAPAPCALPQPQPQG